MNQLRGAIWPSRGAAQPPVSRNREIKRHGLAVGAWVVLLVAVLGCGTRHGADTKEWEELTVAITPFIGEAAIYVALDRGLFTKHGLRVTLRENQAGPISLGQLRRGEADIAHCSETPFLFALQDSLAAGPRRIPSMRIIADMIVARQVQKIVARRSAGVELPQDIRGRRVGLPLGTQAEYHLDALLLEQQIRPEQIQLVDMPPAALPAAIRQGEVDAIAIWEPFATQIVRELGDDAVVLPTRLTISTLWLAVVREQDLRDRPGVYTAYLRALHEAHQYIVREPGHAMDLLAPRVGVAREVLEISWLELDHELSLSERMLTIMEDHGRWMEEKGLGTRHIDLSELLSTAPLDSCCPGAVTFIR